MMQILDEIQVETDVNGLAFRALGARPLRVIRQELTFSGNTIYRLDQPDGQSFVLRISPRPKTFAFTRTNLNVLRALGLPVQSVAANGPTESGGSFIILNWIPGRDLVHELPLLTQAQMTRLAARVTEFQKLVGGLPQARGFGWAPIARNGPLQSWTEVFGKASVSNVSAEATSLDKFAARLSALRSRVEPYFTTVTPTPFLDDLTTKNVLVEHGELCGIIDVDYICYGDPLLTVGATMASVARDVAESGTFYATELARCSGVSGVRQLALWFYAALWAIGFLRTTDPALEPKRSRSLSVAIESWLSLAEAA